jgi:hypothetical protein
MGTRRVSIVSMELIIGPASSGSAWDGSHSSGSVKRQSTFVLRSRILTNQGFCWTTDIGVMDMSEIITSDLISRRRALSLVGWAAVLGLAAPAAVLTASHAGAQTPAPVPVTPPPTTGTPGMQRRKERRTGRAERRDERRTGRTDRREERRD